MLQLVRKNQQDEVNQLVGVRISTRTDLKRDMLSVYESINELRTSDALESLNSVKMNITIYYNTRGLDCNDFKPIFDEIENLLKKNHLNNPMKERLCKEKLFGYLFKLNGALKFNTVDQIKIGEMMKDPILMLKNITDDLIDDYSECNLSGGQETLEKNRRVLELIKNDLLEIREMEPYFKNISDINIYNRFNNVQKMVNRCLMIVPQVKDVTVAASISKTFRTYFEDLFHSLTDIFVPVFEKSIEKEKNQEMQEKTVIEQTSKKIEQKPKKQEEAQTKEPASQIVEEKDETYSETDNVDMAELERKAKEGIIDGEK